MTDWNLIGLMAYIVAAAGVGTLLLCIGIEFYGDDWEIQGYSVDWDKVLIGLALMASAVVVAAVRWGV